MPTACTVPIACAVPGSKNNTGGVATVKSMSSLSRKLGCMKISGSLWGSVKTNESGVVSARP
jgi:hypothetical protein